MGAEQSICCSKRSDNNSKSDTRNVMPRKVIISYDLVATSVRDVLLYHATWTKATSRLQGLVSLQNIFFLATWCIENFLVLAASLSSNSWVMRHFLFATGRRSVIKSSSCRAPKYQGDFCMPEISIQSSVNLAFFKHLLVPSTTKPQDSLLWTCWLLCLQDDARSAASTPPNNIAPAEKVHAFDQSIRCINQESLHT